MRRCHEDDGQDDLASGALAHHRHLGCRGPHGRGQLCQVLPPAAGGGICRDGNISVTKFKKFPLRSATEPVVLAASHGTCPAPSWRQTLRSDLIILRRRFSNMLSPFQFNNLFQTSFALHQSHLDHPLPHRRCGGSANARPVPSPSSTNHPPPNNTSTSRNTSHHL